MNQGMLFVWESADALRTMISKETDAGKSKRLQLLHLLATKQATTRQSASQLLGVHRRTIGRWLKDYESGGLERLLEITPSQGMVSSLPPEIIQAMREKLSTPFGAASFKELHNWVEESFQIQTSYRVIYYTARHVLNARLAVGRPSHLKKKKVLKKPFEKVFKPVLNVPLNKQVLFIGESLWDYPRSSHFQTISYR